MAIERKPRSPVLRSYVPPGTSPYRVKTGDSWVTIAQRHNIDPLKLIKINFRTEDPREVNWYLREYVGCARETHDRRNYVFSSGDTPGIIRVPFRRPARIVMPPVTIHPDPNKKIVPVGLIEKETLYNVDAFCQPGNVKWSGSKQIIRERYDWVPKDHVELGIAKSPTLHYSATGLSKTTIRRYQILWGPKGATAGAILKGTGRTAWFVIKVLTNQLEGAVGTAVYGSWNQYPRNTTDPLNRFRPR